MINFVPSSYLRSFCYFCEDKYLIIYIINHFTAQYNLLNYISGNCIYFITIQNKNADFNLFIFSFFFSIPFKVMIHNFIKI